MLLGDVNPWTYLVQNWSISIRGYLVQHIELTFIAVGIGLLISVPLALLAWRYPLARTPLVGFSGFMYIVPSIALFAIVGAWTGYVPPSSYKTAEIALTGYTLLILLWNTLSGLAAVPDDARDSAIGMGYSRRATLLQVELPLAVPYIFAGLRVATATIIGLVTVTAFIGLGGLGQLLIYGFNTGYESPIIVGLVMSIVLAAVCDLAWVLAERVLVPWSRHTVRGGSPT
ncbi:MAG TPA: ABC transporter permease [Acidimicrobiales bacterium]|jgi:osmoprotectant transport system permease protein